MKRPLFIPGEYYALQNHGNADEKIFKNENDFEYFRKNFEVEMDPVWQVVAWCFVPDGFKMIVKIKENNNVDLSLRQKSHLVSRHYANFMIKYAMRINRRHKRRGSLFARNFKRYQIANEHELRNEILALHSKPIKRKFVKTKFTWPHSSCRILIIKADTLQAREMIRPFGNVINFIAAHSYENDDLAA